jgi:hypothetical protein
LEDCKIPLKPPGTALWMRKKPVGAPRMDFPPIENPRTTAETPSIF